MSNLTADIQSFMGPVRRETQPALRAGRPTGLRSIVAGDDHGDEWVMP